MARRSLRRFASERIRQAGFSIVEMLLVFVLIGVAVIPLATVQFYSRREVSEASRHSRAVQLAQASLERMRSRGFGQSAPDTVQVGVFTSAADVVPLSPTLEELRVTVSWPGDDQPSTVTLSCLQSRR
jgi:Tfp pilus assembly protein PilV